MRPDHATSTTRPRARVFAALVLLLSYLAQPALAIAGVCGDGGCDSDVGCCCAPEEPAEPASGCCSEESTEVLTTSAASAHTACGCQAESDSGRTPGPMLPTRTVESVGEGSLAEWVRVHAERSASVPCVWSGFDVAAGVREASPPPAVAQALCVGWTLVLRGVERHLSLLAVALR